MMRFGIGENGGSRGHSGHGLYPSAPELGGAGPTIGKYDQAFVPVTQ